MSVSLHLDAVHAGYGHAAILHGVDLAVPAGGALTIVGPNGAGKSTLMKTIVGLLRASAGTLLLGGRDIGRLDAPARARAGLAYVPQEHNVFRNLTVRDNLRLGWEFLHRGHAARAQARRRLDDVLSLFPELLPKLDAPAGLLSGGQRQMAAMAAALMQGPALLVLDEPSAGLSPRNAALLFAGISRIRATGVTLLMIEQNVELGLSVADHAAVLAAGRIRAVAPADELLALPGFKQMYLGGA
ncbi:ABC transporter ATP-binding protein [Bordetella sp. N]|uniref:ABC transporter ATP-binding protein n=1 Tax=Bordetella sp. N TaxID=1746199 RepID=UPI00070C310A|nr:ABC transporter ATP-binding protein [Bordetella sp. N]ALM83070.1 ABC transporter ATP-binding protein [Bordetella sp. N]